MYDDIINTNALIEIEIATQTQTQPQTQTKAYVHNVRIHTDIETDR